MKTTIRIQVVRLHRAGKLVITKEEVEGRGTVYSATRPAATQPATAPAQAEDNEQAAAE
jgi:hypothetical protein